MIQDDENSETDDKVEDKENADIESKSDADKINNAIKKTKNIKGSLINFSMEQKKKKKRKSSKKE